MNHRIRGAVILLMSAICVPACGDVIISRSTADVLVGGAARAFPSYTCNDSRHLEALGDAEAVCEMAELTEEGVYLTADSFASVSLSANADNTRLSMALRGTAGTTGTDPKSKFPVFVGPVAGAQGNALLEFSVTDEPMLVTVTVDVITTDSTPVEIPLLPPYAIAGFTLYRKSGGAHASGYVQSVLGETSQSGDVSGPLEPGDWGVVYANFDEVVAHPRNRENFARVELTVRFEPLICSVKTSGSTAGDELIGWNNPAGGSYLVPGNWDPPQVPTHDCSSGDTAIFELVQEPDIFINAADATAGSWRVRNGHYRVHGPAQLFSDSPIDLSLIVSHDGLLQLTHGTLESVHSRIGDFLGASAGHINVMLPGTVWENAGSLKISNGFLQVADAGEAYFEDLSIATAASQSASVTVSGVILGLRAYVGVSRELIVGQGGSATLDVSDGALLRTEECDIGLYSNGTVTVAGSSNPEDPQDTGSYAKLQVDGSLHIGGVGAGTLRINKGGTAIANPVIVSPVGSGQSRIVLDGQGEFAALDAYTRLTVHGSSHVEVEAKNGGRIVAESIWIGGGTVSGTADVTVRGSETQGNPESQSSIKTKNFPSTPVGVGVVSVGKNGPGQLNILTGARADFGGGLVVGDAAQGIVIVSSPAVPFGLIRSNLSVSGETLVGGTAPGILSIATKSDMVTTGDLRIGLGAGNANGTLNVSDGCNVTVNGTLAVGYTGAGLLAANLGVGGFGYTFVRCDTLVVGGDTARATGRVEANMVTQVEVAGNAQVGIGAGVGTVFLDQDASFQIGGTLTIGNPAGGPGGGHVSLVDASIFGGGTIVVNRNGSLSGTGTITVPKVNAGGQISPGLSPGTLTIDGEYEQVAGGRLEIEYAGTGEGEFDRLVVTGAATLDGHLEIQFVDGFSPPDPESFIESQDFVEAGGGTAADFAARTYVYPDLFADFDDDGDKDLRDAADFQVCFGRAGAELEPDCTRADWDRDGVIGDREVAELSRRLRGPGSEAN